jgi:hypothetical protein
MTQSHCSTLATILSQFSYSIIWLKISPVLILLHLDEEVQCKMGVYLQLAILETTYDASFPSNTYNIGLFL